MIQVINILGFGYLSLITTQRLFCKDLKHFRAEEFAKVSLTERLKRFGSSLKRRIYLGSVFFCIAFWGMTFSLIGDLFKKAQYGSLSVNILLVFIVVGFILTRKGMRLKLVEDLSEDLKILYNKTKQCLKPSTSPSQKQD